MDQVRLDLDLKVLWQPLRNVETNMSRTAVLKSLVYELDRQLRMIQTNPGATVCVKIRLSATQGRNIEREKAAEALVFDVDTDDIGEHAEVFKDQAWRDGLILAVVDDRVLIEYQMPGGTTALIVRLRSTGVEHAMSYLRIPKPLLQSMVIHGSGWIGKPQHEEPVPQPNTQEYWDARYKARRNLDESNRTIGVGS